MLFVCSSRSSVLYRREGFKADRVRRRKYRPDEGTGNDDDDDNDDDGNRTKRNQKNTGTKKEREWQRGFYFNVVFSFSPLLISLLVRINRSMQFFCFFFLFDRQTLSLFCKLRDLYFKLLSRKCELLLKDKALQRLVITFVQWWNHSNNISSSFFLLSWTVCFLFLLFHHLHRFLTFHCHQPMFSVLHHTFYITNVIAQNMVQSKKFEFWQ